MDASALNKKRRLQSACDTCKRRKVRCDSGIMPNNVCSGCLNGGIQCTHSTVKRKRGPKPAPKKESKVGFESAQTLVSCLLAEPETYPIPEDPDNIRALLVDISRYAFFLSKELSRERRPPLADAASAVSPAELSPAPALTDSPYAVDPGDASNSNDIDTLNTISERLEKLSLESHKHPRHFGMSSNFVLIQTLLDFEEKVTGRTQTFYATAVKRPQFWNFPPWYRDMQLLHAGPPLLFPENDLLQDLIDIYFVRFDPYMPLLYRSSFEQSVAEGLHLIDVSFGQVVLAVCALASRWSDDPRNMPEGTDSERSKGWRWYRQISVKTSSFVEAPTLYDLQLCVLMVAYLQGSSISESSWILLGIGMRLAQAMGIHRKRPGQPRTVERELWIRAFWSIVTYDTYASMFLGRPRVTTMDDFDVEYPTDCDSEFWDNPDCPDKNFVQPPGTSSKTAFWIHFIKLLEIAGLAHRLIYPIRKSKHWKRLGVEGISWNQKAVIELDSALNEWVSSVPDHVKWDPNRADLTFFHQSVILYTSYYWVQIQVHKPWIPKPDQDIILSGFPSLTICANASRSCIHVAEAQKKRESFFQPVPVPLASVFVSAIVLLINFWRGKRLNPSLDFKKEMQDVYKCFEIIEPYEKQFQGAGRMVDVLNGIISIGHLSSDLPSLDNRDRPLEAHDWIANPSLSTSGELAGYHGSSPPKMNNGESASGDGHHYAVHGHDTIHNSASQADPPTQHNPLPFYTNELGVLPLYSSGLTTSPPHSSIPPRACSDDALHAAPHAAPINSWFPAFKVDGLADLSTLGMGFDPFPDSFRSPASDPDLSLYSAQSQPVAETQGRVNSENSSDGSGDWNLFMRNVDELFQSASGDFRMAVDEAS